MAESNIAYLAGLIDGEGCLEISAMKINRLYPSIAISMICKDVIEWVANIFNVKLSERKKMGKESYKKLYTVKFCGKRAVYLCSRMLQYMHVKRKQAELFLEFADTYLNYTVEVLNIISCKIETFEEHCKRVNQECH